MYKRQLSIAILALCGSAAASHALAFGFGRIPESIAFGQALDLSVPLRFEAGEAQSPGCLHAQVSLGDKRIAPAAIQVRLERTGEGPDGTRVRLRSAVVVQEPLVAVDLAVGCIGAVSRRFVVFADPPSTVPDVAQVAIDETMRVATAAAPSTGAESTSPQAARPAARKNTRTARSQGPGARAQANGAAAPAVARREKVAPAVEHAAPRLKLEEPEELLKAATLAVAAQDAAVASATQAAGAAQAAASAAEQRVAALENSLQDTRTDAAAHDAAMEQLRNRLSRAEDHGRMQSALAALVVALAGLALWLGWRLRALQQARQAGWWQGADSPQAPARPDIAGLADASTIAQHAGPASGAARLAVGSTVPGADVPFDSVPAAAHRTAMLPPAAVVEEMLTRPASVDELIDLEQQAEFFFVLGEEAAAIDLLNAHLRGTGGTCPLPYLSLLEIYRRRQDREGCERVRRRFRHRFDAEVPDCGVEPRQPRDLQDYPAALATLQAAWHAPLQAMAAMEDLLFRKRDGELFELPAYRDVLTLYAVARDRHRMADHETDDVDLLLPLRPGQDPLVSARPSLLDRLEQHGRRGGAILEDQPTAAIDLDLSELARPAESRTGELSPVTASLQRSA